MSTAENGLWGNPHFKEGNHDSGSENFNLAQAVMALAFEQRTANLIAAMQPVRLIGNKEWLMEKDAMVEMNKQIAERMGL